MLRAYRIAVVCLAIMVMVASTASAQKGGTPVIISASQSGTTLTIEGVNFGSAPVVSLGGVILGGVVVNSVGTMITAPAPAMAPGSYLLFVQSGNNKSDAFEMTFGAQGPAGATGATGATGAQGPAGLNGAAGATGATGPAGPAGPAGADGISGGSSAGSLSNATINNCSDSPAGTQTITVAAPSKIFATGRGAYSRDGMNLASGLLSLQLEDGGSIVVATSGIGLGTNFGPDAMRIPIAVSDIMQIPFPGSGDYIAAPGTYTLRLIVRGSDGNCSGTGSLWFPGMSFMLVGPS